MANRGASSQSIKDPTSGIKAGVELISGKNRLLTSSVVTIEQLFGAYPFADSWFRVENTGILNDTLTLTIAATANDPSTPDRDVPQYQKVFTVGVSEVGDEEALVSRMITELNQDVLFKPYFKARKVKDNAIVHIESKLRGEFYNRPNVGDFDVTVTGSASITLGFNNFITRGKNNELAISEEDPRQGILGIAGSLSIQPGGIADRFQVELSNGVTTNMAVNGSVTPVDFTLNAETGFDIFIDQIRIQGLDNGVKLNNFLGMNSSLSNGVDIEAKTDDIMINLPSLTTTREIKRFSSPGGWYLDIEAGGDDALAIRDLGLTPIPIRAQGSFATDDYFKAVVNDNITVDELKIIVSGFRKAV